ncbi:MAG: hypothetical protein HJJLKODD_00738 [Phycisphaerae bacterium]|nr:hypothetical protein [Phycisphaerae bacterium]
MPNVTCTCGAKFRFPDSVIGKKAKCRQCGHIFEITTEDEGELELVPEEPVVISGTAATIAAPAAAAHAPQIGRAFHAAGAAASAMGTYLASLGKALIFPVHKSNIINFLIIAVILAFSVFLRFAACLGMIGLIFITGCYAAYLFQVVESSANGEPELPALEISDGLWEGVLLPALRMIGSWLVVLAPALVYLILVPQAGTGGGPFGLLKNLTGPLGISDYDPVLLVLGFGGMFFWPMAILCIAIGGFASLARIDLIIRTIIRTLPGYILVVVLVFGSVLAAEGINAATSHALSKGEKLEMDDTIVLQMVGQVVGLYINLVAMRAIGLYYFHLKHRFAWNWG